MNRKRPIGLHGTRALCPCVLGLAALLTLACAGTLRGRDVVERQCVDGVEVCLEVVRRDGRTRFVASNQESGPYTFRVQIGRLVNLRPSSPSPLRAVVGPGEVTVLGTLAPIRPFRPSRFTSDWAAALGSMHARHDDRWHYRMPFGGSERQILSQGIGGGFSHTGPAKYSFDFATPIGTPVLAARAGRVVAVIDGRKASGTRKVELDDANRVEVLHTDGTIAAYAHLERGIPVRPGDGVTTGQEIGRSGDTGFTTGPHLHFMVWRRLPTLEWTTVAVRFHDGTAQGFLPGVGVAYAPGCAATGVGCRDGERPPSESVPAAPAAGGGG